MRNETKQRLAKKRGHSWLKLFDALARVARPSDDQGLVQPHFPRPEVECEPLALACSNLISTWYRAGLVDLVDGHHWI